MSHERPSSFKTKRGRCILDSEANELRLTSSWRGQFKRYYEGNKLIFGMMMFFFLAYIPITLLTDDFQTLLAILVIVLIIVGGGHLSNYVRGFTSRRRIPLDAITAAKSVEGSWLTQPRFVVFYETSTTEKKRYVILPSSYLSYTDEEFEMAKDLFHQHGIPLESS